MSYGCSVQSRPGARLAYPQVASCVNLAMDSGMLLRWWMKLKIARNLWNQFRQIDEKVIFAMKKPDNVLLPASDFRSQKER